MSVSVGWYQIHFAVSGTPPGSEQTGPSGMPVDWSGPTSSWPTAPVVSGPAGVSQPLLGPAAALQLARPAAMWSSASGPAGPG